jgi:hypothetical protein
MRMGVPIVTTDLPLPAKSARGGPIFEPLNEVSAADKIFELYS